MARLSMALVLALGAGVTVFAHDPFSLIVSFQTSWNQGCEGYGICNDSAGAYSDLTEGVDSWSNSYGNIQLVTTSSTTRQICVDFPDSGPTKVYDQTQFDRFVTTLGSLDGCYPGAFNTLANTDYGATDIGRDGIDNRQPISAWVYFMVNGVQYELQWKRQGYLNLTEFAPPLKVTYLPSPDTWLLHPYSAEDPEMVVSEECPNCSYSFGSPSSTPPPCPESCASLMVFSNNKPRGRIGLANYVMPFQLTAEADPNNRRRKGKK